MLVKPCPFCGTTIWNESGADNPKLPLEADYLYAYECTLCKFVAYFTKRQ